MCCRWLSVRPGPPPPECGGGVGWLPRSRMEQAHADELPVVIDALDRVSVELELGDDGGWEVNPAGMELGRSDRLVAGLAQSLQQPLLLGVGACHDRIVGGFSPEGLRRLGRIVGGSGSR
jgi:hypothetical protein